MDNRTQSDSGSFITGFTLGIFAGAFGYYAFATKDGKKLTTKISAEWAAAKSTLMSDLIGESNQHSLRDLAAVAKKTILDVLDGMADERPAKASSSVKKTSATTAAPKKDARAKKQVFKGT